MGADGERESAAELQPDRYYLLGDAGSFFFEPTGDNEGFASPGAAAEWARTQTVWPDLDLSDGYAVAIVLGSEFNANQAAWDSWEGGEFPDAPAVHNYARDLGLVREEPAGTCVSTGSCSTGSSGGRAPRSRGASDAGHLPELRRPADMGVPGGRVRRALVGGLPLRPPRVQPARH